MRGRTDGDLATRVEVSRVDPRFRGLAQKSNTYMCIESRTTQSPHVTTFFTMLVPRTDVGERLAVYPPSSAAAAPCSLSLSHSRERKSACLTRRRVETPPPPPLRDAEAPEGGAAWG